MPGSWGTFVHRFRWPIVALSLIPVAPALWLVIVGADLDTSVVPITTESGRAAELMASQLPRRASLDLIFSHDRLRAADPAFRDAVERAVEPLRRDPNVASVATAYDTTSTAATLVSKDGHRSRVIVEFTQRASPFESVEFSAVPPEMYRSVRRQVRSDTLEVVATGSPALHDDFTKMADDDLRFAERITLPIVLLLLLIVFGSGVAAALPLLVAGLAMVIGMAGMLGLSRVTPVSVYAPNLVSMIGLGVSIDYALFVVNRFREELDTHDVPGALARTMATTGRAIVFSGLTVAIGFAGMLLVPIGALTSLGIAGTMVVALAVLYSVTFLPAVLAILGPRVDALRIPFASRLISRRREGAWHRIATAVMAHPWLVLLPVLAVLVVVGLPFRAIRLATADVTILRASAESRRGDTLLREAFGAAEDKPILVLLRNRERAPQSPDRIGEMYDLSRWLARRPGVIRIDSAVDLDPRLDRARYEQLAALPPNARPPGLDAAFRAMLGADVAMLVVHTALPPDSDDARALVRSIRESHPPVRGELLVSGQAAFDADFIDIMRRAAPVAITFVVIVTYVILFFLLRSVILPLKAVVMNMLSITASYGALVWIFQDGHLARVLRFAPHPVEPSIPLIMFCVLFGLSMDYEVLLLSRTREEWERTGDNEQAVANGLERTGRLITGAAAIMAAVFFGFGTADAVMIKAIGVGMGIAVVVDATIVRALLVPATMCLLGRWNWWAPRKPPRKLLRLQAMRAVICRAWGPVEGLRVEDVPSPEPGPRQVLIDVKATGVNYADSIMVAGKYQTRPDFPFSPGLETAGIVARCGAEVTRYKPGDRVMAILSYGGFAEQAVADENETFPIPQRMPFDDAGAFPVTYISSHVAIRWQGRLEAGETMLVLGAAGGVGLTAVEIGKAMGARVIAAASTPEKLAVATERGADALINYAKENLTERVMALTDGKGVDVCFDPVGGDLFDAALSSLGWGGRILLVGFVGGVPNIPANRLLVKHRSALGSALRYFRWHAPDKLRRSVEELMAWYDAGRLAPCVTHRLPLEKTVDAIRLLTTRKAHGKIVIVPDLRPS